MNETNNNSFEDLQLQQIHKTQKIFFIIVFCIIPCIMIFNIAFERYNETKHKEAIEYELTQIARRSISNDTSLSNDGKIFQQMMVQFWVTGILNSGNEIMKFDRGLIFSTMSISDLNGDRIITIGFLGVVICLFNDEDVKNYFSNQ